MSSASDAHMAEYIAERARDYEFTLQSRSGIPYGVRLTPDGAVDIAPLIPMHPSHDCPSVSLDGCSARVLRDWLRNLTP